jgi:hypothetical protein
MNFGFNAFIVLGAYSKSNSFCLMENDRLSGVTKLIPKQLTNSATTSRREEGEETEEVKEA